jgi:hypothetical protein
LFRLDGDIEYLLNKVKNELNDDLNIIILSDHVCKRYFRTEYIVILKGMTNVTKVVRPFDERYIDRSAIDSNFLSGALLNVMPLAGRVSRYNPLLENSC